MLGRSASWGLEEAVAKHDGCARCGDDGVLIGWQGKWFCRDCFFAGPGQDWPRPKSPPFEPKAPRPEWKGK